MLLNDVQRRELQAPGAPSASQPPNDALARVSAGLKAHAPLRAAPKVAAVSTPQHQAEFRDTCAAVAQAVTKLDGTSMSRLTSALPDLFKGEATGAAALREYWLGLGYSGSEIDCYLAELAKSPDGLPQIANVILRSEGWPQAIANFGAGDRDPKQWGFGLSTGVELPPLTESFVTTCRQAGITPSLFLVVSVTLLLEKIRQEVAK
jgi:hypothetical protein